MKPNKTICGVPVSISAPIFNKDTGGSPTVDESKAIGVERRSGISKPGAKRLAEALNVRLPRIGTMVKLCDDQWLARHGAGFEVVRTAAGDFRGARKRRRKARR